MQNIDFYSGNNGNYKNSKIENPDPEYFSRMSKKNKRDEISSQKKASRLISFIIGLCIISFTTGLIVGIKFSNGNNKEIVDPRTKQAVNNISNKFSNFLANKNNTIQDANKKFPKAVYPYVIRIGNKFNKQETKKIANYLSPKGHTIIIAENNDKFCVYTGPYKEKSTAQISLSKINKYSNNLWHNNALLLKR